MFESENSIGSMVQYIGTPKFNLQNSAKERSSDKVLLCHVKEMDWKPFVYHVSCLKIKPKTCLVNRRKYNILDLGPGKVFVAVNVLLYF